MFVVEGNVCVCVWNSVYSVCGDVCMRGQQSDAYECVALARIALFTDYLRISDVLLWLPFNYVLNKEHALIVWGLSGQVVLPAYTPLRSHTL